MQLFLLRHGKAAPPDDPRYPNDADRPLTQKGRDLLVQQAAGLVKLAVRPHVLVTSPLKRARETAEIIATELGIEKRLRVDAQLACGCSPDDVIAVAIRHLPNDPQIDPDDVQMMFVGHEPDFSWAAAKLSGGTSQLALSKGGLIRLDFAAFPSRPAVLRWLLEPRHLAQ